MTRLAGGVWLNGRVTGDSTRCDAGYGRTWARALGVLVLVVSVLVNFAWANIFPFWSRTLLSIDFLAIYAIIAHGGEMKVAREV